MRKILLTIFCLIISIVVNAQTGWVKQKFGKRLTISFPATVNKVAESTFIARDSTGTVCGVVILPIDQSLFAVASSTDSLLTRIKFIDVVVNGIKTKMPKYAIGDIKISTVNNIKTYSLEGLSEENKSTVYINIILVDDVSYSLTCFVPAGVNPANKDLFLKNFSVSK